jgi:hypothetical protein
MYGKLAMTYFTNQVYLYAERSILYLKPKFWAWFQRPYYVSCYSHQTAPDLLFTELVCQNYPHHFKKILLSIPTLKIKRKNCMIEEPSHVKHLYPSHMCKKGLILHNFFA